MGGGTFLPAPITPNLAADTIIELIDEPDTPIVLIQRKNPPEGWAIPGGFVDVGERLEQAAIREAREETSLDVRLKVLLGVYSDPKRDPRGHTITAVYIAQATGKPTAQDDALKVDIFAFDRLPKPLAFDHSQVLADYWRYRKAGLVAPIRME